MSLYGMMRTGGSGMNAQASKLGTVAENIANANTTGYKRASTEFSSLILPSGSGAYNSGGVQPAIRYNISQQGAPVYTSSNTDLAISGAGFFIVSASNGQEFLTRAGSFVKNDLGNLVNSAGFTLMGYPYEDGVDPTVVVNGFDGLEEVNLASNGLVARGSSAGSMGANLPSNAAVGDEHSTSLSVYDTQGNARILDFNYEKTGANTWTITIVDKTSGTVLNPQPALPAAQTNILDFDAYGQLTAPVSIVTDPILGLPVTGANLDALTIDLNSTKQVGFVFDPDGGTIDGYKPSKVDSYQIDAAGVVYIKYQNGKLEPKYRIALASVQSPDKLIPQSGNVYSQGVDSGVIITGFAGGGNFGKILSSTLESSNVDIANELTAMIESQRNYTANSKVFQTGADLLDVLVNLKR